MFETSDGDHLRLVPGAVQVNMTLSIGHGLSSLTRKVADKIANVMASMNNNFVL